MWKELVDGCVDGWVRGVGRLVGECVCVGRGRCMYRLTMNELFNDLAFETCFYKIFFKNYKLILLFNI